MELHAPWQVALAVCGLYVPPAGPLGGVVCGHGYYHGSGNFWRKKDGLFFKRGRTDARMG